MTKLDKYLRFLEVEVDVELLALYALDELENKKNIKKVEEQLIKFKRLKSDLEKEIAKKRNNGFR